MLHLVIVAEAFEIQAQWVIWAIETSDFLSVSFSAQTHTRTEWHASLEDSQVLKRRNLSLICLSSSVLLQWPHQTDRERACTHIPGSKRNLAEIHQLSQKKLWLIWTPARIFHCFKEQFIIIGSLSFSLAFFFLILLIKTSHEMLHVLACNLIKVMKHFFFHAFYRPIWRPIKYNKNKCCKWHSYRDKCCF